MKERPIPFSGPMVRAILAGTKTQTRRVVRNPARLDGLMLAGEAPDWCPYGRSGDRLWVREAWRVRADQDHLAPRDIPPTTPWYCATGNGHGDEQPSGCAGGLGRRRPPMFMPRWASRITLEVTAVRVERLQDITEEDAKAEGALHGVTFGAGVEPPPARDAFEAGWDGLNAKRGYGWDANPWVWVIEFRRLDQAERASA